MYRNIGNISATGGGVSEEDLIGKVTGVNVDLFNKGTEYDWMNFFEYMFLHQFITFITFINEYLFAEFVLFRIGMIFMKDGKHRVEGIY